MASEDTELAALAATEGFALEIHTTDGINVWCWCREADRNGPTFLLERQAWVWMADHLARRDTSALT